MDEQKKKPMMTLRRLQTPPQMKFIVGNLIADEELLLGYRWDDEFVVLHKPTNKWFCITSCDVRLTHTLPPNDFRNEMFQLIAFTGPRAFVAYAHDVRANDNVLEARLLFFALSDTLDAVRLTNCVPLITLCDVDRDHDSLIPLYHPTGVWHLFLINDDKPSRLYEVDASRARCVTALVAETERIDGILYAQRYEDEIFILSDSDETFVFELDVYDIRQRTLSTRSTRFVDPRYFFSIHSYKQFLFVAAETYIDVCDVSRPTAPVRRVRASDLTHVIPLCGRDLPLAITPDGDVWLNVRCDGEAVVKIWSIFQLKVPRLSEVALRAVHACIRPAVALALRPATIRNTHQLVDALLSF